MHNNQLENSINEQNFHDKSSKIFQRSIPQYAGHGDHHHGQLVPEAIYPKESAHGSKQKRQGSHKFSIKGPEKGKPNEILNKCNNLVNETTEKMATKPARNARAEAPYECDEVIHPPLYKYLMSLLQVKILSTPVPDSFFAKD